MTQRDVRPTGDRELEQYLEGGSKLSRYYRDASGENAPPELDEAILAQARAELRRKPNLNRLLTPVAVAASLVLCVNLAWNMYESAPRPGDTPVRAEESRDLAFVPEPPPLASPEPAPQPQRKARAPAEAPPALQEAERAAALAAREDDSRQRLAKKSEAFASQESAGAAAPRAALGPSARLADAAPRSETARIDHLILHVRTLEGAVFMRKGKEYGPAEAAKHLQYKRESSGDRVKTADDFIRLCVSRSDLWGEGYTIRFADGRTRAAEDVLREELARLNAR